nr:65-kDa microtubule-associated protein 3-like [Tanacetum cinerariifolium]
SNQNAGSLKAEHKAILQELEKMKKRKTKRRNQFLEVLEQIQKIQLEIYETSYKTILDESDLSLRKLEELQAQLQTLEKVKVETEVSRLESLKSSKMKELDVKKRIELEDVCRKTHMLPKPDSSISEMLEKVERWMAACEEECWLEE